MVVTVRALPVSFAHIPVLMSCFELDRHHRLYHPDILWFPCQVAHKQPLAWMAHYRRRIHAVPYVCVQPAKPYRVVLTHRMSVCGVGTITGGYIVKQFVKFQEFRAVVIGE